MTPKSKHDIDLKVTIVTSGDEWVTKHFKFVVGESSMQQRLAATQKLVGGQTKMSDGIGISVSAIKSWISRGAEPGVLKIVQLANFSGLSVGYLATGHVENGRDIDCELVRLEEYVEQLPLGASFFTERREGYRAVAQEVREKLEGIRISLKAEGSKDGMPEGFVPIKRLEVRASAGDGLVALPDVVYDEPAQVPFRLEWLRRLGVSQSNAMFIVADGDSMADTIRHGDLILIDRGIDHVRSDGVYVVTYGGEVKVKRIQVLRSGVVLLKSDNPNYDTEEVPPDEVPHLQIEGRVRWVGKAF